MSEERQFIIDKFELSIDYISEANAIGIPEGKLVQRKLHQLEVESNVRFNTLVVFYGETHTRPTGTVKVYWYTEVDNGLYVEEFQKKMFGINAKINIQNN